jgi:hypothetical protein
MSRSFPAGIVFLAGLACCGLPSCTSVPTPAEMLATGFRSPEQCFRTFQCAVRADEPAWEYKCFSSRFRAEHHVSQLVWLEMREQLWSQVGMRWAVAKAKPERPARVIGDTAWMTVCALGETVELRFVREGFGELWSGSTQLSDDALDFPSRTGTQEGRWFYGQVEMPPGAESAKVTEMRLGQEWKLDAIEFEPDT